jgi:hypothetical protein
MQILSSSMGHTLATDKLDPEEAEISNCVCFKFPKILIFLRVRCFPGRSPYHHARMRQPDVMRTNQVVASNDYRQSGGDPHKVYKCDI